MYSDFLAGLLIILVSLLPVSCHRCGDERTGSDDSTGIYGIKASPSRRQPPPAKPAGQTRVVLLGTGTPIPDPARSGPATAVVVGHRAYLVDFGAGVVRRAVESFDMGVDALEVSELNRAFATHLHSDHTAGLSDLVLTPQAVGRRAPLQIFGPPGMRAMVDHVLKAYQEDIGIRTYGRDLKTLPGYQVAVREIAEGVVYQDADVKVTAFEVSHGDWAHAFGYRFDTSDRTIVISGDTASSKRIAEMCKGCDLLVHEVYCDKGFRMIPDDAARYHAASHTSAKALGAIASEAAPKRLVLYHQLLFGCTKTELMDELTQAYAGEVVYGNDLDVL